MVKKCSFPRWLSVVLFGMLQPFQVFPGKFDGWVYGKRHFIKVNGFFFVTHLTVIGADIGIIDGRARVQVQNPGKILYGLLMLFQFEMTETHEIVDIGAFTIICFTLLEDFEGFFPGSHFLVRYPQV